MVKRYRPMPKEEILAELLIKRTCVKCGFTGPVSKFPFMGGRKRDRTCRKCRRRGARA